MLQLVVYYAVVLLQFIIDTEESFNDSTQLIVLPKSPICLRQGATFSLSCIWHLENSTTELNSTSSVKNWSLLWYQNGVELRGHTTIHQGSKSIISRIEASDVGVGMLTCKARDFAWSLERSLHRSVHVGLQPEPVTSLAAGTPRFTSDANGFRYVEVSWFRAREEFGYELSYQLNFQDCFSGPCLEDVIEPTCAGAICTANMETWGYDMNLHQFQVVTRYKECETKSRVWRYNLTLSSCGIVPSTTLLYTPYPPVTLDIQTSYRRVTLNWQDIFAKYLLPRSVLYSYNCSEFSENHNTILDDDDVPDIPIIHLSDKDIRGYVPYMKCTFCLAVQEYSCGGYSQPLCNTTRLHEEPPSQSPNFTCTYDTCPTTHDDRFRNVTVTWTMPPEVTWGGILRELKLTLRQTRSNATLREIVLKNLTSNRTVIRGLNKTEDYVVFLQACNFEGCSRYGERLRIFRFRSTTQGLSSGKHNMVIAGSTVPGLALIILGVIAVVLRSRRNTPTLVPLSEAQAEDYEAPAYERNVYDELNGNNGNDTESGSCLSDQDEESGSRA